MPQLAVETFISQIFWILIGFFVVYAFMSVVVAPGIEETLERRNHHINSILDKAKKLDSEAQEIEKNAVSALERAEVDSTATESKLISSFREQSIKEKDALYKIFSEESKSGSKQLSAEADKCFEEIANDVDDIINLAMNKISNSVDGFSNKKVHK